MQNIVLHIVAYQLKSKDPQQDRGKSNSALVYGQTIQKLDNSGVKAVPVSGGVWFRVPCNPSKHDWS